MIPLWQIIFLLHLLAVPGPPSRGGHRKNCPSILSATFHAENPNMAQHQSHVALDLLSRKYPAEEAQEIFIDKVKRKPLYLRPTTGKPIDARERRRQERARKVALRKQSEKPKPLSAKEKRLLKIYQVPREAQKYHIYEPLHGMWTAYIQEMLGDKCVPVRPATAAKFCSADFHGAELEVVRSRCVGRVGLKGIVVKDTKFAFEIVTRKDEVKRESIISWSDRSWFPARQARHSLGAAC